MEKIERVSFEITGKCNLRCFYCCRGYLNEPSKISNEISTEEIITIIKEARSKGCESFLFTGGEAFVKDDLAKILRECSGCFVEIYTNGTLINLPKNIELLNKYVSRLTVSIDGLDSHNYYRKPSDYRKVIENIKFLKEKVSNVKIKINTLVNSRSVTELPQLYDLLRNLKVDEWHIDFPQLRGRLASFEGEFSANYEEIGENLSIVLKKFYEDQEPFYLKIYKIFSSKISSDNIFEPPLDENPCAYKSDYSMFINAEGKYILCPSIPCQDITIGTTEDKYGEVLRKKNSLEFQNITFRDLKECRGCRYFSLCLGGCRGEAKILSDSFLLPDLNACSLMHVAEEKIYPSLPEYISKIYLSRIKLNGSSPNKLKNLDEMKSIIQDKYKDSN